MGFLRKVGRKIKKGVKKLFSSKIGAFIGSIAIGMMLGPLIGRAFNGIKGALGITPPPTVNIPTTLPASSAGTTTTATAGAGTVESIAAGTDALSKTVTGLTEGSALSSATGTALPSGQLNMAAIEKSIVNSPPIISDTVTGSLNKLANNLNIPGFEGSLPNFETGNISDRLMTPTDFVSQSKTPTLGQEIKQNFTDLGKGIKEFGQDPIGKTKELVGPDFIPDTARSVVGSLAINTIMGEPEEQFQSAGVASQPMQESAQGAYVREVQNQIPNLPATNFQQLNQSLLFGTLSPQYLLGQAQVYS